MDGSDGKGIIRWKQLQMTKVCIMKCNKKKCD